MCIEDDLIPQFYMKVDSKQQAEFCRGQMYRCPCLYFDDDLTVLSLRGTGGWKSSSPLWETRKIDPRHFNDSPHPPLTNPRLEAEEAFVVLTAKKRPVVLLSSQAEEWKYRNGQTRAETFLVAPVYSFDDTDSEEWKLRIKALSYRELFYLPGDAALGFGEGFIRFDRAHPVPRRWLQRMHMSLHPDALLLLTGWFYFYVTGTADRFTLARLYPFVQKTSEKQAQTRLRPCRLRLGQDRKNRRKIRCILSSCNSKWTKSSLVGRRTLPQHYKPSVTSLSHVGFFDGSWARRRP